MATMPNAQKAASQPATTADKGGRGAASVKEVLHHFERGHPRIFKIEDKMGTTWHGFVATDTIKNPALMPHCTTILHVAKAGRGLRASAERLGSPTEAH